MEEALERSNLLMKRVMAHSSQPQPYDENDFYPKIEENVDRKLVRFFDFGKRFKGQIKAMH